MVRRYHSESWDRYYSTVDHDIHGRQTIACKLRRQMNNKERDTTDITIISQKQLIRHYQNSV